MKSCHLFDDCRVGGGSDGMFIGFPLDDPNALCHNTFKEYMIVSAVCRLAMVILMVRLHLHTSSMMSMISSIYSAIVFSNEYIFFFWD